VIIGPPTAASGHERRIGDVRDVSGVPPIASKLAPRTTDQRAITGQSTGVLVVTAGRHRNHLIGVCKKIDQAAFAARMTRPATLSTVTGFSSHSISGSPP
jgi:hypothetical protein